MMTSRHVTAICFCLAATCVAEANGQSQPGPAVACTDVLTAPTKDSVSMQVMMTMHAFDRDHDLPRSYQLDFANAVVTRLRLPQPLPVDVYETSLDTAARVAHLAILGNYSATITADGRLENVLVTGGARNASFDGAMIAAMRAIDSTDQLSMAFAGLPREDVPIRVAVTTVTKQGGKESAALDSLRISTLAGLVQHILGHPRIDSAVVTPLFSLRVPVRPVAEPPRQIPRIGRLSYPPDLRSAGIEGEALASFIVSPDSIAEPGSYQILRATRLEFAQAVLQALPTFRYRPIQVDGCPVRSALQQPFNFTLTR